MLEDSETHRSTARQHPATNVLLRPLYRAQLVNPPRSTDYTPVALLNPLSASYFYNYGDRIRSGTLILDYYLPLRVYNPDCLLTVRAHGEFNDFFNAPAANSRYRTALTFDGKYMHYLSPGILAGGHLRYDATKLYGTWESSWASGVEFFRSFGPTNSLDLRVNFYGKFAAGSALGIFRSGPSNYDVQVGYAQTLYYGGPTVTVTLTGYAFDTGHIVRGWALAAYLRPPFWFLTGTYQMGHDAVNGTYYTVGALANFAFATGM
jgi:hypothetical protein